ncbi:FtsX-like permease family protein [Phytohalomonas tamaricis]|uniref:FtsX-like permease family protein n=1 Tax=Phytohalomonas tamaricis TaxID=2081032 RepID=UPI000D0B74BA|nr:FtsX-like permease family protein [Phytohalomonas tamaricis]
MKGIDAWRALLGALLGHYRRHPGQLAMALLGVIVAGALYSGVQTINAQARDSYARVEALFGSGDIDTIRPIDRPPTQADFARLRRAGVPVTPLVEGNITLASGQHLHLLGIDALSLPPDIGSVAHGATQRQGESLTAFLRPPYRLDVAADTVRALGAEAGQRLTLVNDRELPPIAIQRELAPEVAVTDIAAASALLGRGTQLDALLLPHAAPLLATVAEDYQRSPRRAPISPGQLSESFRLNLTAMGMLALLVGLFIVHSALGLALAQRMPTFAILRALGVSRRALVTALALELLTLGLIGALLGLAGGVVLATILMPGVAATLSSLYDERVAGALTLTPSGIAAGLAMTLAGTVTAGLSLLRRAARVNVLAPAHAGSEARSGMRQRRRLATSGGVLWLIAGALWLYLSRFASADSGHGLLLGFVLIAALLLGAALLLPALLDAVLVTLTRLLRGRAVIIEWALADTRLQLPRLGLALAALLLALTANLGVSSMVGGFRLTFLDWLDQRLSAELYVHPGNVDTITVTDWLRTQPEVNGVLTMHRSEARTADGLPLDLRAIDVSPLRQRYWPLLESTDAPWQNVNEGGALINEQLAHRRGLTPGDSVTLKTPSGTLSLQVAGIYADYGNPRGEVALSLATFAHHWYTSGGESSLAVYVNSEAAAEVSARLRQHFDLDDQAVIDQQSIKGESQRIFERTFAITRALNTLTLAVAALALTSALLALGRWRRAQLAPLWAMGLSRARLAWISIIQVVTLATLTALLALPLGVALTEALVGIINVEAFGWRLPLHIFPVQMVWAVLLAALVAGAGAGIASLRLWRTPPRVLLEEFRS